MAEAGWYEDPLVPGGKRYWDGTAWTDHVEAPPAPGPAGGVPPGIPPASGIPPSNSPGGSLPFDPMAATAAGPGFLSDTPVTGANGLSEIGVWLSAAFKSIWPNIGGALMLFIVIPLVPLVALGVVFATSSVFDPLDPGLSSGQIALVVVLGLAAVVATIIGFIGGSHYFYAYFVGQPVQWQRAAGVGLRRLPLTIFVGLVVLILVWVVLALVIGALFVVPIALAVGSLLSESGGLIAVGVIVSVVVGLALFAFWIWLMVKLTFVATALAVSPSDTFPLSASSQVSAGRFFPILGRLLLLGAIAFVVSIATQTLLQLLLLPTAFAGGTSDFGTTGDFSSADATIGIAIIVITVVGQVISLALQAFVMAAATALYADAGAPNTFGHAGGLAAVNR